MQKRQLFGEKQRMPTEYDDLINRVRSRAQIGRLPHAFLVSGAARDSRGRFALEFAKVIFETDPLSAQKIDSGNYEDLLFVEPDGDSLKVEQVAALTASLKQKPCFADRIVAIISEAQRMTSAAQNKLLKTLEEPAPGTVILVLADHPEKLYPTIRSRCVPLRLPGYPVVSAAVQQDAKELLSALFFRRTPLACLYEKLDAYSADQDAAQALLGGMTIFLRDVIVGAFCAELATDEANRAIASRVGAAAPDYARYLPYIEKAGSDLALGMNKKNCLRDLALQLRQEAMHA
jgi:hypothetical protein